MEIKIYAKEDRFEVAKILIKNGYTVTQKKRKKTPTGKTMEYYLEAIENEEGVGIE